MMGFVQWGLAHSDVMMISPVTSCDVTASCQHSLRDYIRPSQVLSPLIFPSTLFPIMPKALAPTLVQSVVQKLHEGTSHAVISSETGVSMGMISKIRSSHCPNFPINQGGRPSKLSPANIRHASRLLTGPLPTTPRLVAQELSNTSGVSVSHCTVCCQTRKAGVKAYVKPKKPGMPRDHMKARLEFTKAHWD
jgi:transposase